MNRRWMVVAAALCGALAACGGGGDDAGDGGGGGGVPGSPAPTSPRVHRYEALDSAAPTGFQAQLNAEGAKGYRFVSDVAYGTEAAKALFVRDSTSAYAYELLAVQNTPDAFIAQLNAQGARGFRFGGLDTRGAIYRKANGAADTFTYNVLPAQPPGARSSAQFLNQANAEGAQGRRLLGDFVFSGTYVNLYEQSAAETAVYEYAVRGAPASDAGLLQQFEDLGASGFRMKTPYDFVDGTVWIYERDKSQASTFRYLLRTDVNGVADLVAQANAEGEAGRGWIGSLVMPSGAYRAAYFVALNCSGVLCDTRSPFGP